MAVLLRVPTFVSAFDGFSRNIRSPFFTVGSIGSNLPVNITLVFLIGLAAILVHGIFIVILYACIEVSRRMAKRRPVKMEEWAGRFASKMTDEVSSILTHCSAATLVLMTGARSEFRGTQTGFWCEDDGRVHVLFLVPFVIAKADSPKEGAYFDLFDHEGFAHARAGRGSRRRVRNKVLRPEEIRRRSSV